MIWPIIYRVPYAGPKWPIIPGTYAWLSLRVVMLIAAFVCGYVSAYWSKPSSIKATIVLAIWFLVLTLIHEEYSMLLKILNYFMPLSVVMGAVLYRYRTRET